MRRLKRQQNTATRIGMVSLPVMACVLAAVLFASQQEEVPPIPGLDEALAKTEPLANETRARVDKVKKDVEKAIATLVAARKLQLLDKSLNEQIETLLKEKERLEKLVTEAQQKSALQKKIKELEEAIRKLNDAIARLKEQKSTIENRIALVGLDEFPRPYISVECKKDGVTVHVPGQEPRAVTLPFSGAEAAKLKTQIAQVEGMILFVRASGFSSTYSQTLRELDGLVAKDSGGDIKTALSFVPIQDSEDISGHILLGGGK